MLFGGDFCLGLSNRAQAIAVSVSAGLLAVGTYIAVSPAPESIKAPLATAAYIAGMIGFAIKEALGGQAPPQA